MNNLPMVLSSQGKHEQAEKILRQTLSVMEPVLQPDILISITYLVIALGIRANMSRRKRCLTRTQPEGAGVGSRAYIYTDEHEQPGDGVEESLAKRAGGRDASTALGRSETVLGKACIVWLMCSLIENDSVQPTRCTKGR